MRWSWKFGQQLMTPLVANRYRKDVLIEYDGPRLTVLTQNSEQFLALCIDEDAEAVRWIHSPLSALEYEALMRGALSVRAAMLKAGMLLVEYNHDDSPRTVWELDPSTIPAGVLPESGVLLPDYVRHSFQPLSTLEAQVPAEFHLGTKGALSYRIPFSRLSKVTESIQNLWDAIGGSLSARPVALNAVAALNGSLKLRVEVDDTGVFSDIANIYGELTRATYHTQRLNDTLSRQPLVVAKRYSEYLRTLDLNSLDVLAEWHVGVAFVGHAGAERGRTSIVLTEPDSFTTRTITSTGFLEGFGRTPKHFEFFDPESGARISGTIHKDLRDTPLREEVHLGHRRKYRVEIEAVQRGSKPPTYTLIAFALAED